MKNPTTVRIYLLGFLVFAFSFAASAQETTFASFVDRAPATLNALLASEPPAPPVSPNAIIGNFLKIEAATREALNQHAFKRDVVLQTIGPDGNVTGEYIRNSQFIFDDRGNRIERVLYHPASTIREMRITKEDIQDLAGAQLLGVDVAETGKYHLTYLGADFVNGREAFVIDVAPAVTPDPQRMKDRFFVGRMWIDAHAFHIIKAKGIVEPQGKQRFPIFETWREPISDSLIFPSYTTADDTLHFPRSDVHYRIRVKYYDYKRFASRVSITEVEPNDNK